MFNKLRLGLILWVALAGLTVPSAVGAFTSNITDTKSRYVADCHIAVLYYPSSNGAYISLNGNSAPDVFGWIQHVTYGPNPVTVTSANALASFCGFDDVSSFSYVGADAASFAAEDEIAFRFTARVTPTDLYYVYDFSITGVGVSKKSRHVYDVIAPVISGTSNLSTTTSAGSTAPLAATVSDNVNANITPVFSTAAAGTVTSATVFPLGVTTVTVNASDTAGNVATPVTFTVTVADDDAPIANAGADANVASATSVTLSGSGQDTNVGGSIASYAWTQTSGTPVMLSNSAVAQPSFTAPTLIAGAADETLVFKLVVNDGHGNSASDSVTITIKSDANTAATANAGPDANVNSATSASLDGTLSNANDVGQILTYAWSQDSGTGVTLSDATVASPTFTAPTLIAGAADEALVFSLIVNDGFGVSVADTVTITIKSDANTAATANAGPDANVNSATSASLDGTLSNANDVGQILTYAWSQDSGTGVTLSDATVASPTFTAPTLIAGAADEALVFSLIVNDGFGVSVADTVTITIKSDANTAATANAGPDANVNSATSASLDGTGSNANDVGQILTYAWSQTSGTGVTLSDATVASPSFTAPTLGYNVDQVLTFSLVVNDGIADSSADTVSITVKAPVDVTVPTVSIQTGATSVSAGTSVSVTVTFSENVTGFVASDIAVSNGSVTNLSGSGASYVATIMATGGGPLGINIPASIAVDVASNDNTASNSLSIGSSVVAETQEIIAGLQYSRANQLVSNQPELTGFLSGHSRRSALNATVSRGTGMFNFTSGHSAEHNMWMQVQGSWSNEGTSETQYVFGVLGSHIDVTQNLIIGAMAEFDFVNYQDGASRVKGTGWLVGPYFVSRIPEQDLFIEGRLLYGQTSNEISPYGTYTDDFDTTRWLAQVKVSGELEYGNTTLRPHLSVTYTTDDQHAYTDSLGNDIASQGIELAQAELGLDFSHFVDLESAKSTLEITGGISAIGSSISGSGNAALVVPDYANGRAKVKFGVDYTMSKVALFSASAFYDGIGVNNYESYGLRLGIDFNF